jgi:hypothetical protein
MKILLPLLAVLSSPAALASPPDCKSRLTPATEAKVRKYMVAHGMIRPDDESDLPEIGVQVRWSLDRLSPAPGNACHAILFLCTFTHGERTCQQEFDAVGLRLGATPAEDLVVPFESLHKLPKTCVAKIGFLKELDVEKNYYYVKLQGESVVAAAKSWILKVPYGGFSGVAVQGGKAKFDPTPGRTWRVVQATFDLRRGNTAETLSINSGHFDSADAALYWKGCIQGPSGFGSCQIAPWEESFIRGLAAEP